MLFNYGKCKLCKNKAIDVKLTMSNILPVNVCNAICEYGKAYCKKCCEIKDNEEEFINKYQWREFSKFQLQLIYFMQTEQKKPISFYWKIGRKHYEKDVDIFFSNEGLIKRLGVKKLKPYKAFIKKHRMTFETIDNNIDFTEFISASIVKDGIDYTSNFKYYNKEYNVIEIMSDFMCEYIRAIVREDNLHFLDDENDIIDYVDATFRNLDDVEIDF